MMILLTASRWFVIGVVLQIVILPWTTFILVAIVFCVLVAVAVLQEECCGSAEVGCG